MFLDKNFISKYYNLIIAAVFILIIGLNFYFINKIVSKQSTEHNFEKRIKF